MSGASPVEPGSGRGSARTGGRRSAAAALAELGLVALLTVGCGGEEAPPPPERARMPASFETEDTLPSALKGIPVEPVQGRTGPGGDTFYVPLRTAEGAEHLYRRIGRETFRLPLRTDDPDLVQYPCSSCHESEDVTVGGERDTADVHHNVKPVHPAETGADCATCHAQDDVARLTLATGETTSLNHAYRLCARCHSTQVNSWAHGAHGKRLVGWRGRRVVMGCAACHDPHNPETQKRIPYQGPEIPRSREGSP